MCCRIYRHISMKLSLLLEEAGLNSKEAALYLALLELGSASVVQIARSSGVVRSTTYEILERLRTKRLVTTFLKKRVRYYSAEDPTLAVRWAQSRSDALKAALPELMALTGKNRKRPAIRYYEGKEGITIILEEILAEAQELIGFRSKDKAFEEVDFFANFVERRITKKIPLKMMLADQGKRTEKTLLGGLTKVRYVSSSFPAHGIIYVWKNKVAQLGLRENDYIAIVTESSELAETQRAVLSNLWNAIGE